MFLVQWQECLSRPYQEFRLCPEFALYLDFVSEARWVFSLPSSPRNHPSPPPSSRTGLRYFASPSFFFLHCLSVSLSPSRRRNRRQYSTVGLVRGLQRFHFVLLICGVSGFAQLYRRFYTAHYWSADQCAKLWNVQTGAQLFTFNFDSPTRAIDFGVDDKLAVISTDPFIGLPSAIHVKHISSDPSEHGTILFLYYQGLWDHMFAPLPHAFFLKSATQNEASGEKLLVMAPDTPSKKAKTSSYEAEKSSRSEVVNNPTNRNGTDQCSKRSRRPSTCPLSARRTLAD